MFKDRAHQLCSRLAEEVRQEIQRDRRRVKSTNVAKLLVEIDQDLLHPDATVETLRRRCGIRDKNVSTVFKRELGRGPKEYSIDKRMQVAARALAASDFEIGRIGANVGYLTPTNFSRAFKEWGGQTPEEFRAAREAPPADAAPALAVALEEIEEALAGRLEEADRADLADRLGDLQDRILGAHQTPSQAASEALMVEKMAAAYLWRCIEHASHDIQRTAIESHAAEYDSPALFLLLSTASVEASEHDPEDALRLAELARASLRAIEDKLGDGAPPFQVRAHAVTGFALTRAGRLLDAKRAFVDALEPLETMDDAPNPVVLAELSLYLGLHHAALGEHERAGEILGAHASLLSYLVDWVKERAAEERREAGEGEEADEG